MEELKHALWGRNKLQTGSKDDLAIRLLTAMRDSGEKPDELLRLLDVDRLKELGRDFGLKTPDPGSGFTEKGRWVSYLAKFAKRRVNAAPPAAETPIPTAPLPPAPSVTPSSPPQSNVMIFPGPVERPPAREPPSFENVWRFLESYVFREKWKDEEGWEAEIFGALVEHFGPERVARQVLIPRGKPDLVVYTLSKPNLNGSTIIEVKVPQSRGECEQAPAQLKRYRNSGITANFVAVLIGSRGASPGDLDEAANELQEGGVRVSKKYHH